MMNDLISRQEATTLPVLPKEYREYQTNNLDDAYELGWNDCQKYVEQLPPAQPEIIRCGECKWFRCNMRMDGYLPKGVDEFECRLWDAYRDPVDFCNHAERRTDELGDS